MYENIHSMPSGTLPQKRTNKTRNIELAVAISKYSQEYHKSGNSKECDRNILEAVRGWAMEIVFNCDAELDLIK